MWGKCKACICKDAHIADLQSQVATQQKLLFTPTSSGVPVLSLEADGILSVNQDIVELTPDQKEEYLRIDEERHRLLSGNY